MNEKDVKASTKQNEKGGTAESGTGPSGGDRINFQEEFRTFFSKGLAYQKMVETALAFLDRVNPAKEILPELKNLDEQAQKDIKDSIQGDMQEWLEIWRSVLKEGKTLPVDIIGMASDMARLDRKRFKSES